MTIDLNCDMGEGMANDSELMRFISSANIACGFHAGNEDTMRRTIELALLNGVAIGAHPGFADKDFFGRRELKLSHDEVYDLITMQIAALKQITDTFHTAIHHVKPHGALYNMAARQKSLAHSIVQAIKNFDDHLILYGLSGSFLITEAEAFGLQTASEVFADRTYQDDGSLTHRSDANALIEGREKCIGQVLQMITHQSVTSINNRVIPIMAQTVCIHGDGKHALSFAHAISESLKHHGVEIKAK